MIIGIGVDVVNLDRFAAHLQRTPRLRERLFSTRELGILPDVADADRAAHGSTLPVETGPIAAAAQSQSQSQSQPPVPDAQVRLRTEQLAARFAAKEALIKALGGGIPGFAFSDVSIVNDAHGAPHFELSGAVAAHVQRRGVRLHVSLAHDAPVAQAFVVAECFD